MVQKYYAVVRGNVKNPIILKTWNECKKVVNGYSKAKYKSFNNLEDAEKYLKINSVKNNDISKKLKTNNIKNNKIIKKNKKSYYTKICPICGKPYKQKIKLCSLCNKQKNKLNLTIGKILYIKEKYRVDDVFKFIEKNQQVINEYSTYNQHKNSKRKVLDKVQSDSYKYGYYKKWEGGYPIFVMKLFYKKPNLEFLTLSGSRTNPNIYYRCLACKKEYVTTYNKCNFSHNCDCSKSSGEIAVENYLKNKVIYFTQFDTLKCKNPITKRYLPYDFEIPSLKIIIEVQGEQHFKYIKYFHRTIENFEYQQYKDKIKKEYAKSKGYHVVYIDYNMIDEGSYKNILNKYLCDI